MYGIKRTSSSAVSEAFPVTQRPVTLAGRECETFLLFSLLSGVWIHGVIVVQCSCDKGIQVGIAVVHAYAFE
jgi:hypothetical protein